MATALSRLSPAQSGRDLVYVASGFWIGLAWLIFLTVALSVGLSLVVVTIGLPILAVTLLIWRWGADLERQRAALVLGEPIRRPADRPPRSPRFTDRWGARIRDRATWRDLGYMVLLGPVGIAAGAIVVGLWAVALAALLSPLFAAGAADGSFLGDLDTPYVILLALGSVVAGAVALLATRGLALACAALATALLGADDRAELSERITTLEASRSGAVESADARLRRIERDLHDGAQHRLAYIAMELGRARSKLPEDPAAVDRLLEGAHDESKRAMRELRDLVRGIHPSVLSDRGLDAALSGLAERASVPVEIHSSLDRRLAPAVETAAYYVVAETLTNVGRHSGATRAEVDVRVDVGQLVLSVADDGHGGAVRRPGSGLEGLAQRVEALDGTLAVTSPPGGPTTITAWLPCGS